MDSKDRYLELENAVRKIRPTVSHSSKESLYKPDEQYLRITDGNHVIRTIKEEDADIMWHAGFSALESYFKKIINN